MAAQVHPEVEEPLEGSAGAEILLPDAIDVAHVAAELQDGVLTVTMPKLTASSRRVSIT